MAPSPTASCDRCGSPVEMGDLRCAICGQGVSQAEEARTQTAIDVLRCDGCGAALAYDPDVQAARCSFCESVMHVETIEDPVEQTEAWLPFTVDRDAARQALRGWLKSLGFFRPSDLVSQARVDSLKPLWWVAWIFDADSLVSWAADSDLDSGRSDWAPHSGQVPLVFDDIIISASRGLSASETDALVRSYDLETAEDRPPTRDGAILESFDVQRSQARRFILRSIERFAVEHVAAREVPGRRHRNVHVACRLQNLETRRFALPAWVLAYRYKGQLYRAVISGQDARAILGRAPYSTAKIVLTVGGGVALVALLILVIILLSG